MSSIQLTLSSDKSVFKVSYSPAIDLDLHQKYEIALIDLSFLPNNIMSPGNLIKPFKDYLGGEKDTMIQRLIVECSLVRNSYLNDKMEKILNHNPQYPIYVPIDNTDRIKEIYIKILDVSSGTLKPIEFSGEMVKIILHIRKI